MTVAGSEGVAPRVPAWETGTKRRITGKVKRYLFTYFFLGQVAYQFDRSNIGFANLTMGKELALSAEAFGFASGIFALSAFLMQLPAGLAFDKFGPRKWLTAIMVAWGLVVLGEGFVTNGTELAALRFLLGIFEAGFLPGIYIVISIWFRGKQHGAAMATLMLGTAAANIFGGPLSGWLLGTHFFGLSGWRNLFIVDGAVTVIWALLSLYILADGPENATWLKPNERAFMVKYLSEYEAEKKSRGAFDRASLWQTLKNPEVITLILAFGFSGWIASTFTFFIPTLLKRAASGVSVQYVGFLMMGPYIVYAIVAQVWGRHADRTERHWHSLLPLLVSIAGIMLYPISKTPIIAMVAVCLIQAGTAGFFVNFWPTANMVVGRSTIAKSTALINSGNQVLSFLGPVYFGWALDKTKSTTLGLYTAIGVLVLNFVLMHIFFLQYKARQKALSRASAPEEI
jgi:ACS family tartrate transporter-like MFS transporter